MYLQHLMNKKNLLNYKQNNVIGTYADFYNTLISIKSSNNQIKLFSLITYTEIQGWAKTKKKKLKSQSLIHFNFLTMSTIFLFDFFMNSTYCFSY